MPETIDVLIPNFLTADLVVAGIIEPLREHLAHGINLVIVDDGSPDDDTALLLPHAGVIWKYEHADHTQGPAATFNRLLELAKSDLVFLCNSDVLIPNVAQLHKLAAALDSIKGPAIVGTAEGPRFYDKEARPYTLKPPGSPQPPCPQDYVSACAMMFRREHLPKDLKFSTAFTGGYYEDADFCYRLRRRGWLMGHVPTAIGHIGHQAMIRLETMRRHPEQRLTMFAAIAANREIFLERWAPFLRPKTDDIEIALKNHHQVQRQLQENTDPCPPT